METFTIFADITEAPFQDESAANQLVQVRNEPLNSRASALAIFNPYASGKIVKIRRMSSCNIQSTNASALTFPNPIYYSLSKTTNLTGKSPSKVVKADTNAPDLPATVFCLATVFSTGADTIHRRVQISPDKNVNTTNFFGYSRVQNLFQRSDATECQPIVLNPGEDFYLRVEDQTMQDVPVSATITIIYDGNTYRFSDLCSASTGTELKGIMGIVNDSVLPLKIISVDIGLVIPPGLCTAMGTYYPVVIENSTQSLGGSELVPIMIEGIKGGEELTPISHDTDNSFLSSIIFRQNANVMTKGMSAGAYLSYPIFRRVMHDFISRTATGNRISFAAAKKHSFFDTEDTNYIVLNEGEGIGLFFPRVGRFGHWDAMIVGTVENKSTGVQPVARAFA